MHTKSFFLLGLSVGLLLFQLNVVGQPEFRTVRQYIFGAGETMEYSINYGVIPAGTAKISVAGFVLCGDRICYKLVSEAKSRKAFDPFFKVRDRVESWMDALGLFTWRFEKSLNEGGYHDHKVVAYDYENRRATVIDDGTPTDTTKFENEVQDALSSLFWARILNFKSDTTLNVETLDVKKVYQVKVDVIGLDTVSTPAGDFRCYKVEPHLEGGGIFKKDPEGRIWLWISNDALKIPVMMQTKVFFGHITARLVRYRPGKSLPMDLTEIREMLESKKK
jgi:hypothetical protein